MVPTPARGRGQVFAVIRGHSTQGDNTGKSMATPLRGSGKINGWGVPGVRSRFTPG